MLHQFLAEVKPQVAVLAGIGVLVTHAAPVQHHFELPMQHGPWHLQVQVTAGHQLKQVFFAMVWSGWPAPKTSNMCLDNMDFPEKNVLQWLHGS